MNETQFFLKYNKKFLDADGAFGPQCVDVIKAYFKEVLGKEPMSGNAIDYWRDIPGFTRIKNSLFAWPKPGDIIIWNTQVNPYGHIAICNWSRSFDLGVFEQNYPIGAPCQYRDVPNYKNILGWLRPNPIPPKVSVVFKLLYISDTDDLADQVAICNQKLADMSGGLLQISYDFRQIPPVMAPSGFALRQEESWKVVDTYAKNGYHGTIFGYYGDVARAWYSTSTTPQNNLFSAGQKRWPADVLLFEIKHQLILFYNHFRGSYPFVELVDNYDGGEAIIRAQIAAILPYLVVFRDHQQYN